MTVEACALGVLFECVCACMSERGLKSWSGKHGICQNFKKYFSILE